MHKKWMKTPSYRKGYAALEEEFVRAAAAIDARSRADLTQEALARRMGTTQPVVARLESGRARPSMRTLDRLAKATGSRLIISFATISHPSVHLLTAQRVPLGGRRWGRYLNAQPSPVTGAILKAA
jgi:transcriptional regulator with XRE-family HTH domain